MATLLLVPPVLLLVASTILVIGVLGFALQRLAPPPAAAASATATATATATTAAAAASTTTTTAAPRPPLHVLYASTKGQSRGLAERLVAVAQSRGLDAQPLDLANFDAERLVELSIAVFVVSTYTAGVPAGGCAPFVDALLDMARDFRVSKGLLGGLRYAVFGCGNSEYPKKDFNAAARRIDRACHVLGASRLEWRCDGDDRDNRIGEQFDAWLPKLLATLTGDGAADGAAVPIVKSVGKGQRLSQQQWQEARRRRRQEENQPANQQSYESSDSDSGDEATGGGDVDLEDLAGAMVPRGGGDDSAHAPRGEKKEMVSAALRASLTKQGYRVVGSHSGVKLCRWTKAMLRGRGGCYKHTFYGIMSSQCMEATPSLACANKCVFCWRHHDNPVGTSFRWQVRAHLGKAPRRCMSLIARMISAPSSRPRRLALRR